MTDKEKKETLETIKLFLIVLAVLFALICVEYPILGITFQEPGSWEEFFQILLIYDVIPSIVMTFLYMIRGIFIYDQKSS